ncbi:MAG: DUF262 domain-containing protein, partial [Candidatus Riflebacteria bacterium]|nr:DUF262 domain-containing protein [Candidatus Riflebacteria bacterium]
MIRSVHDYRIDDVFKKDAGFCYLIPKYQRDYTWGQYQWKDLYDDINENDYGYFIGSIICIDNSSDAFQLKQLEVVDGQQRLTTLCLLLTAIYNRLKEHKSEMDEDNEDELPSLRKSIICKGAPNDIILCPQIENNNLNDFLYVMYENGLVKSAKKEKNWGKRRIAKCYKYFLHRIDRDIEESGEAVGTLLEMKKKVSKAVLVKIEVGSHAEAYTLFESLNNRGTPLTAIDLMKNLILAKAEKAGMSCDDCYDKWQELLGYLTEDYGVQERFFRQYYNAFKNRLNEPFRTDEQKKRDPLGYIATRSNLLSIFEELINKNLDEFIEDILVSGKYYSWFVLSENIPEDYKKPLEELAHIQGVPSYLLLLYLFRNQNDLSIEDNELIKVIKLLTRFFVRRNITDTPNTRDLIRIFMNIIADIENEDLKGDRIYFSIYATLKKWSATDEFFAESLKGDIYEENVGVARFVLCSLAEKKMTTETWTDLWGQNEYSGKKVYKWTIEHIFPEGKNIPKSWVDMIAGGDKLLAEEYLISHVHKIGNLTVTGYNSSLSNLSFLEKRDRVNSQKLFVGYKNGLEINKEIAQK